MEEEALKSQHVKATDHSGDPEETQEGLRQSRIASDAKTHEERAIRAEAWASRTTKMHREREKQKSESVPLRSANHVSPMDAVIASWEKKAEELEQCKQAPRASMSNHSHYSKSRHSRPQNSDPRPQKKARFLESSNPPQTSHSFASNDHGRDSLFQEVHAAYDWSDEDDDDPDPHPNKATPQQRATVRKGLREFAESRGFESKSAKKSRKRREKKLRQALTGLPPVPPAFPTAPPAPPNVHFTAPPASPAPFAAPPTSPAPPTAPPAIPSVTPYAPNTVPFSQAPEEHLDELGLPELDYVDDDVIYEPNHVHEMDHLDGGHDYNDNAYMIEENPM